VQDIGPGADESIPQSIASANGRLFFSAVDLAHGREPWSLVLLRPTSISLALDKTANKLTAHGSVVPKVSGNVKVTLARKQAGHFIKLSSKTVGLQSDGGYSASLGRPNPGTCKMTASFLGNLDHAGSKTSKTFDC
jgi:hypothetical protein